MKKLEIKALLQTPLNEMTARFPKEEYGFTRGELMVMKRTKRVPKKLGVKGQVQADRLQSAIKGDASNLKRKYDVALKSIGKLERELSKSKDVKGFIRTKPIVASKSEGKSEGKSESTAIWVASDWHIEETVGSEVVGLNVSNMALSKIKAENFFRSCLRLTKLHGEGVKIENVVLALLGDFISNDIHDELAETNEVEPIKAIWEVQSIIASGIQYVLDNSTYKLTIPCHSGNHARTTEKTRFSSENGHSLEYYMYLNLASHFKNEPRVRFEIADGLLSYMQVYSQTIRFTHGHALKYGGGIGGIFIPAFKAISQWDKARRADLTIFGHFHQTKDGGNFLCNGSLIGYNAYALSIKADFEKPCQSLVFIDSRWGRNCTWRVEV